MAGIASLDSSSLSVVARPESPRGVFFVNKEIRKKGKEEPQITLLLTCFVRKFTGIIFGVSQGERTIGPASTVAGHAFPGLGLLTSPSFPFFLHSLFFYTPLRR
jgi:hypothetical protein